MASYGKIEYWEDRYQKDKEQFDWLQRFNAPNGSTIMPDTIAQYCLSNSAILIVGCGNSRLPEEMHDNGYQHITCIDFSYSAIQLQKEEYKDGK